MVNQIFQKKNKLNNLQFMVCITHNYSLLIRPALADWILMKPCPTISTKIVCLVYTSVLPTRPEKMIQTYLEWQI